jgi:hypothetical protein
MKFKKVGKILDESQNSGYKIYYVGYGEYILCAPLDCYYCSLVASHSYTPQFLFNIFQTMLNF